MEEAVSNGKDGQINFEFNKVGILKNKARARINLPGQIVFKLLRLFWPRALYHFLLFQIVLVLLLKVF